MHHIDVMNEKPTAPAFSLRLPADLKARLTDAAYDNRRSLNAEIVARLAASLEERRDVEMQELLVPLRAEFYEAVRRLAQELVDAQRQSERTK